MVLFPYIVLRTMHAPAVLCIHWHPSLSTRPRLSPANTWTTAAGAPKPCLCCKSSRPLLILPNAVRPSSFLSLLSLLSSAFLLRPSSLCFAVLICTTCRYSLDCQSALPISSTNPTTSCHNNTYSTTPSPFYLSSRSVRGHPTVPDCCDQTWRNTFQTWRFLSYSGTLDSF